MNPLRDPRTALQFYVASRLDRGVPLSDVLNSPQVQQFLRTLLNSLVLATSMPARQQESSAGRTVMMMPAAREPRMVIEEVVEERDAHPEPIPVGRLPSEPAPLPRPEAPQLALAHRANDSIAERPVDVSDGSLVAPDASKDNDASNAGNNNLANRLAQQQRQNLDHPSPILQRPLANPNNIQNRPDLPQTTNINQHQNFIAQQIQGHSSDRLNPFISQPVPFKTVAESTHKQPGQFFSPTQQSVMIKTAQQSERTLKSPEFGTQARLILESGLRLAPQTTSILKELSTLSFVLNYAKTATSETPPHPTLPLLEKELQDLEHQTLEILQPGKNPEGTPRESFAARQEALLNQLKNGLDGRMLQLKNQMSSLTEELDLPMKGQMSILLGRDTPMMKGQMSSLAEDTESPTPEKPTSSPMKQSSLPPEEMPTGTRPEMQEMRQTQTLAQNLEKPPLMMPPKEARLIFPESLRVAVRVQTQGDLNAAIKGVQDVSKTKSSNPIIMLPYPFERRAEGPRNFQSKGSQDERSKGGFADIDDEEQPMVFVPKGIVLVGDIFNEGRPEELPVRKLELDNFLIGVVPVTNHQFASWLNKKLQDKKIVIKDGMVFDLNRKLFAKTKVSSLTSQIEIVAKNGDLYFCAAENCEDNPVVQVSWHAAHAFCEDNGVRLPSEAEWEKAAGMESDTNKNRYGFSLNNIDFTRTNYQLEVNGRLENRTTPVGFYNGDNVFHHKGELLQTQNGAGPYGCYDMSGNVREWTADTQENKRITKGGSYMTSAFELRVAAKLGLNPDETYDDVGFRVALTI